MSSKEKNLNGTQISKRNAEQYIAWEAKVSDEELIDMIRGKILYRPSVAEQCGFDRTQLTKNPIIKVLFPKFEKALRKRGLLPELTEKGKAEQKKPTLDKKSINAAKQESRVPYHEQHVIELKAENDALKGKLGRFSELNDVYNDMDEL